MTKTTWDLVLQHVTVGLSDGRGIAISDGKRFKLYKEGTETYNRLQKIARQSPLSLPIFYTDHKTRDYEELLRVLDHGAVHDRAWLPRRRITHSMPALDRGRRSDGEWWLQMSPVDFLCPKCKVPFPCFGRYVSGYHLCDVCGHRDFDVSSVGV